MSASIAVALSMRPTVNRPACWPARRRSRTWTASSRAQALIADDARTSAVGAPGSGLHRGRAAPADRAPRSRRGADARPRPARGTAAPDAAGRGRHRCRRDAAGTKSWPRSTPSWRRWKSAASRAKPASKNWTSSWADAQERHAELDDAVIAAERQLADAREQQRTLERQAQEARFQARALAARRDELQRSIETARSQVQANLQAGEQLQLELGSVRRRRGTEPACRPRWNLKL